MILKSSKMVTNAQKDNLKVHTKKISENLNFNVDNNFEARYLKGNISKGIK